MPENNIQIQFNYLDIENCFKNFYVVPDYQREYVWSDVQVGQLLDDIYEEYAANALKEYFIGSTVVFKNTDGFFELIDGQQRTTTIFLMICAFKKVYGGRGLDIDTIERMLKDKTVNALGDTVDQFKLELQYRDSSNILEKIAANLERPDQLMGSAERLFTAYETIVDYLKENFSEIDPAHLKKFFVYVYRKVKFIQIETPEINDALKIFETINERGVGLNPMDLLKNLLFRHVERNKFNALKDKWKTLINLLEVNREKPLRFLRYFIMANFKVNNQRGEEVIREDEIYKWFIRPENILQCNYEKRPFEFVELMYDNAVCYVNFFKGLNRDGSRNIYLDNIARLGGGGFKQHLILLLAARDLPRGLFDYFAKQVETLLFYYFITREQTKIFERNFSSWAKELNVIRQEDNLRNFVKKYLEPVVAAKENEYRLRFMEIRQNSVPQYRLRYLLAKLAQYIDQERMGAYEVQSLHNYITKGVEIEHILPQNPLSELRTSFGDDYDDFKIRLGNLTLLEKTMNVIVGNDFFEVKSLEYAKSPYYMSKSIAGFDVIGVNSSINRLNQRLKSYDHWDRDTIINRQEMLFALSKAIWKLEA